MRLRVSGITSAVKVALVLVFVFVFAAMISLPTREGALPDKEEVTTAWEGALPAKEEAPTAWEGAPEEDTDVTVRHTPLVAILSPTCVP